jgi:hypothetical protein
LEDIDGNPLTDEWLESQVVSLAPAKRTTSASLDLIKNATPQPQDFIDPDGVDSGSVSSPVSYTDNGDEVPEQFLFYFHELKLRKSRNVATSTTK